MILLALLFAFATSASAQAVTTKAIADHNDSIWSLGAKNSSPDIVRFRDRWYVALREDDFIRIIGSVDSQRWEPIAKIDYGAAEAMREPRLSVTPDNRLMLAFHAVMIAGLDAKVKTLVRFSHEGKIWTPSETLGDPEFTATAFGWNLGKGLIVSHSIDQQRVYMTTDGVRTTPLGPAAPMTGAARESAFVYLPNHNILSLTRREDGTAMSATSVSPYRGWRWRDAGLRIDGPPNLLRIPDGRVVAAVKIGTRTTLCWLNATSGELTEFLALPSSGELGHAGLAWSDGLLLVAYGSAHEGKQSIYLARVRLPLL